MGRFFKSHTTPHTLGRWVGFQSVRCVSLAWAHSAQLTPLADSTGTGLDDERRAGAVRITGGYMQRIKGLSQTIPPSLPFPGSEHPKNTTHR